MCDAGKINKEAQRKRILENLQETFSNDALAKCLEIAIENREFEIKLFWKRSAFFWLFVAAIFLAIAYIKRSDHPGSLPLALSIAGTMFSFTWSLLNRASKSWQESWEIKVETYSEALYKNEYLFKRAAHVRPALTFYNVKNYKPLKYSVSKLLMALTDYVLIFWFSYSVYLGVGKFMEARFPTLLAKTTFANVAVILFATFTLSYMVWVLVKCQSDDTLIVDVRKDLPPT